MMTAMRRLAALVACSVVVLGACSSSDKKATTTSTTAPAALTTTTPVSALETTSTSAAMTTTTICPAPAGSIGPVTTPVSQQSALLHAVSVTSAGCSDRVTFAFESNNSAAPNCKVEYQAGPFVQDASGAPVTVAGSAFVVVRCSSAYSYDYETGRTTYAGPKRIDPKATRSVREVVETGDNEGVITWVLGLTAKRQFVVAATGAPTKQLVITIS